MPINVTDLARFTGTDRYYRWSPLFPHVVLTEGAMYVAENAGKHGAFWLMDAIASYQYEICKKPDMASFQLWTLEVFPDKTGRLTCKADSDQPPEITQMIDYTDFDLSEFSMYCLPRGDGKTQVILLRSEY